VLLEAYVSASWPFDEPPPRLASPEGIDLWRIDLGGPAERIERLAGHLDGEERERAARLATAELARRFAARRGGLREVLARYAGCEPREVSFVRGPTGRPFLVRPRVEGLEFSASDSGDLALVAVAVGRPIGVDLERRRPVERAEEIAARWFEPMERARFLERATVAGTDRAFLEHWTRLEAVVKARGAGIFATGAGRADGIEPILEFEPREGYLAALASLPGPASLRWWSAP
jgi:4'-phosphopantetheinyl transferase